MELKYVIPKIMRKIFDGCAIRKSKLDKTVRADIGSVISNSEMGRYSYIGRNTSLSNTTVGSFTCISNYCAIGGGSHPMEWAAMSPVFNNSGGIIKKKLAEHDYVTGKKTYIGNDVWIGSHCLIKSGVTIADGAVIGMGSVVTKDVGPYEVWAGVPAKMIKKRFDEDTIQALLNTQWWDKPETEIKRLAQFVPDVDQFIKECL